MREIIVVSGLPRSGTSMMMQILEAGGLEILTDNSRVANVDNEKGYYELEMVKKLPEDTSFLKNAEGKVIKVISELLEFLPAEYSYKVIFMRRKMSEILASQKKMMERRGKPSDGINDDEISQLFEMSIAQAKSKMNKQSNVECSDFNYNEMMADPVRVVAELQTFLGVELDTAKMVGVPQARYYRNRN